MSSLLSERQTQQQWPTRDINAKSLKSYDIGTEPLNTENVEKFMQSIINVLKSSNKGFMIKASTTMIEVFKLRGEEQTSTSIAGFMFHLRVILSALDPLFLQAVAQYMVFSLNQFIVEADSLKGHLDDQFHNQTQCQEALARVESMIHNPVKSESSQDGDMSSRLAKDVLQNIFTRVIQVLLDVTIKSKTFESWRIKFGDKSLDTLINDDIPLIFKPKDGEIQKINVHIGDHMDMDDVFIFNANIAAAVFDAMIENSDMSLLVGLPELLSTYLSCRNNHVKSISHQAKEIHTNLTRSRSQFTKTGVAGMAVYVNPR